jgi:tRNA A-37 threonylcarbamoyl transferase component Bud32
MGSGGMGAVFAATHLELGHRVAIKFLHDGLAQNAEIVERFLREARAVVQLRTDHVCRVLDVSRLDSGAPFIIMELLEGNDLSKIVAAQPLPLQTAVEYVMQACVALAEAHSAGIVHRDLKPANLFLTRRMDGGPLIKVLDFGIAKALADSSAVALTSDALMGSPGYMSPEQIESPRGVDARTDIWSLGVTLYQLMSRRLPFVGDTVPAVAVRISTQPPDPLDVDPALRAIVWRCLEKDRARRYPDVGELARDLARFGGPNAAALAALTQQILYKRGPSATAATEGPALGMTAPPAGPQVLSGYATAPAKPSRWPLIVGALVALAGIGIAIAVVTRGGSSEPQVVVPKDAAAVVVVTPPVDAAEPVAPPIDAGVEKTVKHAATPKPKPKPADPKPADPKPADPKPADPKPAPSEHPVWEKTCSKVSSRFAALAPPGLITKCMCLKRDQAAAQTAYDRISRDDRTGPREECAKLGIKLHE